MSKHAWFEGVIGWEYEETKDGRVIDLDRLVTPLPVILTPRDDYRGHDIGRVETLIRQDNHSLLARGRLYDPGSIPVDLVKELDAEHLVLWPEIGMDVRTATPHEDGTTVHLRGVIRYVALGNNPAWDAVALHVERTF